MHVNSQMFVKKQKSDSEQQVYTLEEEQKLIKQAWLDYENKPEVTTPLAVILLFYLGLRVGEVVALREADIKDDRLIVRRTESRSFKTENEVDYMQSGRMVVEHTKTSAGHREIYLVPDARKIVEMILKQNRINHNNGGYLFIVGGKRIHDSAIRWRIEKYCNKAEIVYRSPHKIRKTWISKLIDESMNINTIRELAGHEDERTTYKNYCFDRKTKKQRQEQMENALIFEQPSKRIGKIITVCA